MEEKKARVRRRATPTERVLHNAQRRARCALKAAALLLAKAHGLSNGVNVARQKYGMPPSRCCTLMKTALDDVVVSVDLASILPYGYFDRVESRRQSVLAEAYKTRSNTCPDGSQRVCYACDDTDCRGNPKFAPDPFGDIGYASRSK